MSGPDAIRRRVSRAARRASRSTRRSRPRRPASPRCSAPPAAARPRCCAASPGSQRLPEGYCARRRRRLAGRARRSGPPHQRPIGYVFQEAEPVPAPLGQRATCSTARRARRSATGTIGFDEVVGPPRPRAAARPRAAQPLRRRAPARRHRPRPAVAAAAAPDGRAAVGARPADARTRSCPSSSACTSGCRCRSLYVSHDMAEVERLADHLVLMEAGRVIAAGPLERPAERPVAAARRRRGTPRSASTRHRRGVRRRLRAGDARGPGRPLPGARRPPGAVGQAARLRILAGDVSLARDPPQASTILNALPARILSAARIGRARDRRRCSAWGPTAEATGCSRASPSAPGTS